MIQCMLFGHEDIEEGLASFPSVPRKGERIYANFKTWIVVAVVYTANDTMVKLTVEPLIEHQML